MSKGRELSSLTDGSGNVGININTPTLAVSGTVLHVNETNTSQASIAHFTNGTTGSAASDGALVGLWSDNTTVLYSYDTPVYIGGNGAYAIQIDTSNRVTMSLQPSFVATKSNGNYTGGGNITSWNSVSTNVGSHFNGTTGVFTAPVAGKYLFTGTALLNNSNSAGYYYLDFEVNGGAVSRDYQYTPASTYNQYRVNAILTLSANDTVNLAAQTSGTWYALNTVYTQFFGRLLG